jgi:tetratricopeptide (TPR) repeat protein
MFRHPLRTIVLILLLTAAGRSSLAAKAENWIQVRSPNFVVLTNANEKQGRRVAFQFEMIRAVFRQFFDVPGSTKDPLVTIIAVKNEDDLKLLLPEFWEKKGSMHPGGFYLGGPEKNYVGLRLDVTTNKDAGEPFEPIYHEYVHFLTRRMMSQLPLWLVEGLAEFYGNIRIESKKIYVGAPSATNLTVLRETPPLPLSTLFAVNASSPYYHEENKASIFYAESWGLTHYLITRDWREGNHHVAEFVNLLGQGVGPDEAARRTIGDPERLQEELIQYIGRRLFTAASAPIPPALDPSDFQAEVSSDAESLTMRADFMAHDRHYQEAQEMLQKALKLDPKLAAAHESMGFVFAEQGKMEEANKWYSQAVALNSQSYLANYYFAVSLFKGTLDEDSAGKAESSLRAAIKIAPDFAPAYEALAWLLTKRHANLEEAYRMAVTAVNLEPGNVQYRTNAARVLEVMGRGDDAVRVAQFAVSMAQTPQEQADALAVLSRAQQYQEQEKKLKEQEEAFSKAQSEAATVRASQTSRSEQPGPTSQAVSGSGHASATPTTLRQRNEALPGDKLMPAAAMSLHAPRPELLAIRKMAEGIIEDAKCSSASTLEIKLKSTAGVMQLYSDNYFKIPYSALNFTPKGILNPCTDIKGWHARITYRPAKGQATQGEMGAVGLVKD